MTVTQQDRDVVQGMFDAMQMGLPGEEKMMALFSQNASMTDPFDGEPRISSGKEAIRQRFIGVWSHEGPPDLALTVDQIDAIDGKLRVEWTCNSSLFLSPMTGVDYFKIANGLIDDLVMEVTQWPQTPEGANHE